MERSGSGFKTIYDSYENATEDKKPVVLSYPGFLIIRLFDLLLTKKIEAVDFDALTPVDKEKQRVINLLERENLGIKEILNGSTFKSRRYFIVHVINPLIADGTIERVGNLKSRNAFFRLKK